MSKILFIIGFGLFEYGLGWIAGRLYKKPRPPILYETDGTFLNAIYDNGVVETLAPKSNVGDK